ncbi:hypothetical protein D3C84_1189620 [compost metagenome]
MYVAIGEQITGTGASDVGGDSQAEQRKGHPANDEQPVRVWPQIAEVIHQHGRHGDPLDEIQAAIAT